MLKLWWCLFWQ